MLRYYLNSLQINDSLGNNNGRIDAGENVTITFNVTNWDTVLC